MKITARQLRQIIREEYKRLLWELDDSGEMTEEEGEDPDDDLWPSDGTGHTNEFDEDDEFEGKMFAPLGGFVG